MNLFITVLLEFFLVTFSILILFKYRDKLGLAPLYIFLGSTQYLQANLGGSFSFHLFGEYEIYPGSIILFSAVLFAILLIYIKSGVPSARALIIGIITSNIIMTLLFEITTFQQGIDTGGNNATFDPYAYFVLNFKYFLIGTGILLMDYLLLIILYQYFISKIKKLSFFLVLFISLFTILIFDAFVFNFFLYFGTPTFKSSLISHLFGKSIAAFIFSIILFLYLKYFEKDQTKSEDFIADQDRDILSIIKYRQRYLTLKQEKKQVELELTSQLESTLRNISDGFVALDANWCYTYLNEKAAEFIGRTPESLIGKHIWTEFPEGKNLPIYKEYNKAFETQKTLNFEDYYEPLDMWFENRVYPSPKGLTIYFTDITEKKKADINNQMLQSLIETSDSFIGLATLEGKPLYLNSKGRKLVGLSESEALSDSIKDFFPKAFQDDILNEQISEIFNKNIWKGEMAFKHFKTQNRIPIDMSGFLIRDDNSNKPMAIGIVATDITQRKQAKEKLIKSESLFRELTSNAPVGIFQTDKEGSVNFVNEEWLDYTGLSFDEALGFGWSNAIHPDDKERVVKAWQQYAEIGGEFKIEFRFLDKKNNVKSMSTKAVETFDSNNNLYGYIGMTVDISERKEAEEQIKTTKNYLDNIINNIGDPVFVKDATSHFLIANDAFLKLFNRTKEEIIGNIFAEDVPQEERERYSKIDKQVITEGVENIYEDSITNSDGETRYISTKKTRFIDSNGNKFLIGVIRDVTEQKNAEKLAIESKEYLDKIINNLGDPVFVKNEQSQLILVNDAFCKIFQLTKADITGKTLAEKVPQGERESFLSIDKQVLETGIENVNEESITIEGKETQIIATKKTRFIDSEGNKFLIGIIRDITERKKAEKEILQLGNRNTRIIETSLDGFILADTTGKILDVNPAYVNMIGYTQDELLTMNINQLEDALNQTEIEERINEMVSKGFARFNSNHKKKNGKLIDLDVSTFTMQVNEQPVVAAFVKDITESKKSEIVIKESIEKYSKAFNSNVIGKGILNKEKRIIEVNDTLANIVGFKRENMLGKTAEEIGLFNFDDPANLENEAIIWREFSEKGFVSNIELKYLMNDGKELFILLALQALQLNNEDHVMITIIDITEKKNVETELDKYRNKLEELVEQRTAEVNSKNNELERMNKLFVGRELKMKELKNIIKELQNKNDD
ncbi:PAS domain S-box protein [Algibacter sp.]|uniref:PAS domain S-box protein n=1 Tax=Algibacter sp. TaxID=1872428 RepID=UPI003C75A76D